DLEEAGFKVKDVSKWLNEKVEIGRFEFTRGERIALYRHSLNEDNKASILGGGFGLRHSDTPNRSIKITENQLNEIIESMTPDERAFAGKSIDNLFEAQGKALDKVFYEKNGYPMPAEENYYPKDTMPLARGVDFEKESFLEVNKGKWTRISLQKGMLEKRRRVIIPLYVNSIAYDINKSVINAAAYVGLEIPLNNASKLLYHPDFRTELSERYGEITWQEIEKGLRDIGGEWQSYTTVEKMFLKLKSKFATAALGLNPFVMLKQPLSYAL
ncbi:unnamed protein product, partial [marine sediment metagenome]